MAVQAPPEEARGGSTALQSSFALDEVLARMSGDADLLAELAGIVLEDAPQQLAALARARDEGDRASIKSVAHSLRGSVANLGARHMVTALRDLEAVARVGTLEECAEPLARAEQAWRDFESALRAWMASR